MEPFFFESRGDRLFGVYHPAKDVFSKKAVLICPPIYAEYFRTYRYFRNLADAWSLAGHHVLRFDYFGTGDSNGHWRAAGPARWLADIAAATTELLDISGCSSATLAGARFGATLALLAASESGVTDRVVILDPIVDGADYLDSLQATHKRLLGKSDQRTRQRLAALPSELAGFRREAWLDTELPEIRLRKLHLGGISSVDYVASSADNLDRDLVDKWTNSGVLVNQIICEDNCDWGTPSESAIQAFNVYEGLRACL